MADTVHCDTHGETDQAFVCRHLAVETAGLGFNREEPSSDDPYPDAWCDNCELIRAAHDGWNDEAQELVKIALVCSRCYEQARIHNTRTLVTLEDLDTLRWKCGSCDEWHTGPCLDFGFSEPASWNGADDPATRWSILPSGILEKPSKTFLDEDFCAVNDEHFFVRGLIHLPIIGTMETLCWGVWGSLSRINFETLLKMDDDENRTSLEPMFSWLNTRIPEYPDTLNLKMHAHIQKDKMRPHFELEPSDHPLAQEYHHGIAPDRVREIMLRRLSAEEQ